LLRFVRPKIAVVRRDLRALGRRSATMLIDHLAGDTPDLREVRLPTSFENAGSIAQVPRPTVPAKDGYPACRREPRTR
jgi:DNA-binding LacI/PurR family transcriptional regulator